jgi:hypothetical protein
MAGNLVLGTFTGVDSPGDKVMNELNNIVLSRVENLAVHSESASCIDIGLLVVDKYAIRFLDSCDTM